MLNDLSGKQFGYLTVSHFAFSKKGQYYWYAKCDCGNEKIFRAGHLKSGHTVSCGCKSRRTIHGETGTRLYRIWCNIRSRCSKPSNPQYADYGGRGITVCSDWEDYTVFRDWALANGYSKELSIDRIDNNKGYCPSNCRWTTARTQANNTRKTRFLTYKDETHSVSEWARLLGIKQSTLNMRLNKYGWSVEDALGKAVKHYGS